MKRKNHEHHHAHLFSGKSSGLHSSKFAWHHTFYFEVMCERSCSFDRQQQPQGSRLTKGNLVPNKGSLGDASFHNLSAGEAAFLF